MYTYDTSPSGDKLRITRCDEGHVQLVVQSGFGDSAIPICIAASDAAEVAAEIVAWAEPQREAQVQS